MLEAATNKTGFIARETGPMYYQNYKELKGKKGALKGNRKGGEAGMHGITSNLQKINK